MIDETTRRSAPVWSRLGTDWMELLESPPFDSARRSCRSARGERRHDEGNCSVIVFSKVVKQYGRQVLFTDASFQINPGEKAGLVGPNGCGKTTLFRLIVGAEQADEGTVSVPGKLSIAHFRQELDDMSGWSVLDEAIAGSGELGRLHHEIESLQHEMSDPEKAGSLDQILARYGEIQHRYEGMGGYALESQGREVLHGLGFADDQIDDDVGHLSGGWKMRVSMAQVLLGKPDVLLLDEPTNHLDIESILWLERFLKDARCTLIMTSHDRDFMNRVVDRVVEVDGGEIFLYTGNYDNYERERALRNSNREAAYARQQAMLAKESRFIERFKAHAAKAAQVQSRVKALDKIEKIEPPRTRRVVQFDFRDPPRSGEDVAVLEGISKRFGPRVLYDGFDMMIRRGERWCVMGKNGAGKTTLLKMVVGALDPDAGTVRLGASLKVGYFAQQSLDLLSFDLTVLEQIQKDFPLASLGTLRNLLGAFQFSGDDVDKPIRVLSGGEKSRLVLARMLFEPPNFLVLDEPTNHLDLVTKEMLVVALKKFEGTMLFVSHDRTFLRGLANRVLELGGEGTDHVGPMKYPGTYEEYTRQTGREAPGVHN
jgi:ATPase subunit of ABC transporter with duplicated ATPase domains